jgi:glycosyltransferase involved in cell wall biosynthesis
VCYLASGKPVVAQDTGPSSYLPDGEGLFHFKTIADAVHAFDTINGDYERQCRLARRLAEEHFDAKAVTRRILERAL